jgi:hypothetical protein
MVRGTLASEVISRQPWAGNTVEWRKSLIFLENPYF